MWAWLGSYDVGRDYVARLFDDAQIATVARVIEHTPDELNALLGTLSFWSKLAPQQREAVEHENRSLYERLGRPIRSSILGCRCTHTLLPPLGTHRRRTASHSHLALRPAVA